MKTVATILSTILLVGVFYGCTSKTPPSHLDVYHLKGNVKSIHKHVQPIEEGKEPRNDAEDFYYEFNRQGLATAYHAYNHDFYHKDVSKEDFSYNSKGYLEKHVAYNSWGGTNSDVSRTYRWGEDGNPTEAYLSDGSTLTYSYYAADGSVEQTLYNSDGSVKYRNCYNKNNQPLELCLYENGSLSSKIVFAYNPRGYLLHKATYDGNSMLIELYDYQAFDSYGNPTLCERVLMEHNQLVKDTLSYAYEYDSHNNWINCMVTSKGKQVELITRAFEYY